MGINSPVLKRRKNSFPQVKLKADTWAELKKKSNYVAYNRETEIKSHRKNKIRKIE